MAQSTSTDPFDDLLTLEDTLYTSAYSLGASDGARAGRIEGRIFGLEKGFEKFALLGQVHGRAVVWGSRLALPTSTPPSTIGLTTLKEKVGEESDVEAAISERNELKLPQLRPNERLQKHIQTLHALTDPPTFSTLNTEDAVADYDDRFRRAGAKCKIIERITERTEVTEPSSKPPSTTTTSPNAVTPKKRGVRVTGKGSETTKKGDDGFEDFGGSGLGSRFLS